jgi:hypothetical protein
LNEFSVNADRPVTGIEISRKRIKPSQLLSVKGHLPDREDAAQSASGNEAMKEVGVNTLSGQNEGAVGKYFNPCYPLASWSGVGAQSPS